MPLSPALATILLALLPGPSGASAPGSEAPTILVLVPYILVFALFYYMLFAPARRKQKTTQEMLSGLKAGDKVVLTCGIYGTILAINGEVVQLRIADKVKIDVARSGIAGLSEAPTQETK